MTKGNILETFKQYFIQLRGKGSLYIAFYSGQHQTILLHVKAMSSALNEFNETDQKVQPGHLLPVHVIFCRSK